jgi:hypothetical protein
MHVVTTTGGLEGAADFGIDGVMQCVDHEWISLSRLTWSAEPIGRLPTWLPDRILRPASSLEATIPR